jgi:class 3 adenylate cyclase/tetratricopeptide (TPR) repeat protein
MRACANCGHEIDGDFAFCPHCGAELAAPAREQRKTVTVLFCDVTGSTSLGESVDPEALRTLLARYFERMKRIVERHGGSVEKFIGDAVMAVFGVPVAHEDDALRAVRAAVEMREALPDLGLEARIGVNTGEVATGTEERLATGDVVNVAARLEQAAQPGEVLVGEPTLVLVRDSAQVEPVGPLELKGKAEPVAVFRLLRVDEAPQRLHETPFVGRERELAILRKASERVEAEQRCGLVTIAGDAGVGKSRLVAEFLRGLEQMVVHGRCLPYGEGITYWPVVEVLKQLDILPSNEAAAGAIRSLLGETEVATSAEEIAWAFRKTLEQAAANCPLVVIFDDIQWGEATFLDLIEHVALLSSGAAVLLVCMARPELIERRPNWLLTFRLEPLADEAAEELIPEHISGKSRERIRRAAGGNPLFIEEIVAMSGEAEGEVIVPPTLQALLAARLDQLEPAERRVLERGAVEGEIFHRGAVQALAPEEMQVTPRLAALVRKQLLRPDTPQLADEDAFRFRHLLIRDAAYEALPKATRADLHERFAVWLEEHGTELVELDELLGYHLEQACRYGAELGLSRGDELAAAARNRLTNAARRASFRMDFGAAINLFERAALLVPPTELDLAVEVGLIEHLRSGGRRGDALRHANSVTGRASEAGDQIGELCGRIEAGLSRIQTDARSRTEQLTKLANHAIPIFAAARHDLALYVAYRTLGLMANARSQMDAMVEAYDLAYTHAQQAGLPHQFVAWGRFHGRFFGTTPVSELLAWQDEEQPEEIRTPFSRGLRAVAVAMVGRFDEARARIAQTRAEISDRGWGFELAQNGWCSANVELLAGNPAAAAELLEDACRLLDEGGEHGGVSNPAGELAQAYYTLERFEDAHTWAARSAERGARDDAITQMLWRQISAKLLARRGEHDEAERFARDAVALGEETDVLNAQGAAYADLGEVLSLAERPQEAAEALEHALARYERKENVVIAGRMRVRLAALRETSRA